MKFVANLISYFSKNVEIKNYFVFYKIVNFIEKNNQYVLQCINTKAIFYYEITDLIFDLDILYGLHPIQACYVGMEYANFVKTTQSIISQSKLPHHFEKYSAYRYGAYCLAYQNREGKICFSHQETNKKFIMYPQDIASSKELISEFDAAQAFHIGYMAALKINADLKILEKMGLPKHPYMSLLV